MINPDSFTCAYDRSRTAVKTTAALEESCESAHWEQRFFYLLFIYFAAKAVYFSLNIHAKVFPDETSWFGMIEVFSRSYLPPVDSPESYSLGLITHIPNLYFFLMGKIMSLNPFPGNDLVVMRLVNAGFCLTTVFFAWRLVRLLLPGSGARLLFLVMLTNTLMFTFISGAVNYDNLATLFAVLSLYYLVLFQQQRTAGAFLWLILFLLAGMLTKNVFLPYAAGLVVVLMFGLRKIDFSNFSLADYGKLLLVLVLLGLNINLYAGNKIRYGQLIPSMDQVLSLDECLQNRLYVRGYVVRQFKNGKLSMLAARRLALQIRDPGDRASALEMLAQVRQEKAVARPPVRMGRLAYSVEWARYITARLYGIAAHLSLYKSGRWMWGYYIIVLLGLGLLISRMGGGVVASMGGVLFIFLFYTLILMQVVNYNNYKSSGFVGLALTGRYLFPVIVPMYMLIAHGLMAKMPKWWQWGAGLAVSGFFILGGFPWFLQNVTPNWYF